jgi:uncharacterized membrane protein YgcG
MKRVVLVIVALGVLVLAVLLPALTFGAGGPAHSDETTISRYVADFTVDRSGDLAVTETLTVEFPDFDKHGIFRFFDRSDPSAPHARRVVHDVTVSMDGHAEQFDLSTAANGRYDVVKIGAPNLLVDRGTHTYVIGYHIDGVLEPGTNGSPTQFYWNLIPSGWAQEIEEAHLTVHLPAPAQATQCAIGVGATDNCTATGGGSKTLRVDTGRLAPRTPVTIKTGLPMATPPAGTTLPWTARFDGVLGDHVAGLVVVLLFAGAAGVAGAIASWSARERKPAFPLQYEPPPGVGPAEGMYIVSERVDNRAFVASLLWAAQQGAIILHRNGDDWTITDKAGAEGWGELDPVTAAIAPLLGGPGGQFTAKRQDVRTGQVLASRIEKFEEETRDWGRQQGLLTKVGLGSAGSVLVIGVAILAGVSAFGVWLGMSITGLVPGAFALAASPLLSTGAATKRTAAGRDLWSRLGGFERVLSTPSSKQRFDFSGRQELYTAYIPWAVAFGCADQWAKKYRTEMGVEPPVPAYFGGMYVGDHTGDYVKQMVGDFSSTVSSSISAYQATQSHSGGGGGGGFSGGGGGGGGGGGSW